MTRQEPRGLLGDGALAFIGKDADEESRLTLLRMPTPHESAELGATDPKIAAAVTGLLGQVACADRPNPTVEADWIRRELGKAEEPRAAGVAATCSTLLASIPAGGEVGARQSATIVGELADPDLKLLVLDHPAGAGRVALVEANTIRRLADGLAQAEARQRHRLASVPR